MNIMTPMMVRSVARQSLRLGGAVIPLPPVLSRLPSMAGVLQRSRMIANVRSFASESTAAAVAAASPVSAESVSSTGSGVSAATSRPAGGSSRLKREKPPPIALVSEFVACIIVCVCARAGQRFIMV
jgi:hypothetical protein